MSGSRSLSVVAIVLGGVLGMGPAAWGSLVTFSDRAAFEQALGQFTKYTFDVEQGFPRAALGYPAPISSFGGGAVEAWGEGGSASIQIYPGIHIDTQVLWGFGDILNLRFNSPQRAVGFELVGDVEPAVPDAFIHILHGDRWEGLAVGAVARDQGYRFVGFISSEPITGLWINGFYIFGGGPVLGAVGGGIDNLTISSVPEPGILGLLTCAVVGLLRVRRRA